MYAVSVTLDELDGGAPLVTLAVEDPLLVEVAELVRVDEYVGKGCMQVLKGGSGEARTRTQSSTAGPATGV